MGKDENGIDELDKGKGKPHTPRKLRAGFPAPKAVGRVTVGRVQNDNSCIEGEHAAIKQRPASSAE